MATHSSILAWRIPQTGKPGRYSPWDSKQSGMTQQMNHHYGLTSVYQTQSCNWASCHSHLGRTKSLTIKAFSFGRQDGSFTNHYLKKQHANIREIHGNALRLQAERTNTVNYNQKDFLAEMIPPSLGKGQEIRIEPSSYTGLMLAFYSEDVQCILLPSHEAAGMKEPK